MTQEARFKKTRPAVASPTTIRLVVVDPYPIMRFGMARLFAECPDINVVGEFSNCAECCDELPTVKPDVALVDLGAIEDSAIEQLNDCRSGLKTIGYSRHDSEWHVIQAIRVGIKGFFVKTTPVDKILESIRIVCAGGLFLEPALVSKVLNPAQQRSESSISNRRLSQREREILEAMAFGQTNKSIANKFALTERTVKYHVSSILRKFDASNRAEAIRFATHNGIIKI